MSVLLIFVTMNKKIHSNNLVSLINHLVLKLMEKRRMFHILFMRKSGEVLSLRVTIYIFAEYFSLILLIFI